MGMTDEEKKVAQRRYNKTYYNTHKEEIQAARRKRYQEDPEYRRKAIDSACAQKRKIRAEKKTLEKPQKGDRGPYKPKKYSVTIEGKEHEILMFTGGYLAMVLDRKTQVIRAWEVRKHMPDPIYRDARGVRLYTDFQMKKIVRFYREAQEEFGEHQAQERLGSTGFFDKIRKLWEDFPYGVDLNELEATSDGA